MKGASLETQHENFPTFSEYAIMTSPEAVGQPAPDASPRIRVAAIIIQGDGVLMVRHEKNGQSYWLLPGGGCEYGEAVVEALVRELKEETGLDIRVRDLVIVNDSIPPDRHRHILNLCFTADIVGGKIACRPDERLREARFVPLCELPDLTVYPDMKETLIASAREGFSTHALYLGNLWRDASLP